MAEDESGTLGLMIPKSSREKISPTVRASRENALERTRQLEVRPRSARCRGGSGDAQGKASAKAVTPTTSAACSPNCVEGWKPWVADGQSRRAANFEKRERAPGWRYFSPWWQPVGGTGLYLLERLAAARRGVRVLGDNARLGFLLADGFQAERRADGDADGAASAEARDARRRSGVTRTERERACAGASARAHRGDAHRRRGADGGTDEHRRHDGPRCPRPAVYRVTGTPATTEAPAAESDVKKTIRINEKSSRTARARVLAIRRVRPEASFTARFSQTKSP